jgi:hypothetical protein
MTTAAPSSLHPAVEASSVLQRAMAIWPRLDRRTLADCASDPRAIAAYVADRTRIPIAYVTAILEDADRPQSDPALYFG